MKEIPPGEYVVKIYKLPKGFLSDDMDGHIRARVGLEVIKRGDSIYMPLPFPAKGAKTTKSWSLWKRDSNTHLCECDVEGLSWLKDDVILLGIDPDQVVDNNGFVKLIEQMVGKYVLCSCRVKVTRFGFKASFMFFRGLL